MKYLWPIFYIVLILGSIGAIIGGGILVSQEKMWGLLFLMPGIGGIFGGLYLLNNNNN